eukprot:UN12764
MAAHSNYKISVPVTTGPEGNCLIVFPANSVASMHNPSLT